MIARHELNPKGHELTQEQSKNQDELLYKMCVFRHFYGGQMVGTSGVRSKEEHIAIYERMGRSLESIPMGSMHLKGAAWDVKDTTGSLMGFCIAREDLLVMLGLWVEIGTKGWVHFQSKPYASWGPGKSMFFYP